MAEFTYDKILNEMKKSFFNETGKTVENISDIGARFQAVASELYSISCYGDFVLKQAFPQTATGKYLDNHAQLRGITRFDSAKAEGELTFSLEEAVQKDVEIPQGTICSLKDEPFIQFVTTENAVITNGNLSVTVPAKALESGSSHNVGAGKIDVIVNPPASVSYVNNQNDFSGGCDYENDYSLRKRLLSVYKIPLTGFNSESFRQVILQNNNIVDCLVSKNENCLKICVKTLNGMLEERVIEEIENSVYAATIMGLQTEITLAEPIDYNLTICINSVSKNDELIEKVKKEVKDYTDAIKIGENLNLLPLTQNVSKIEGVENCIASSAEAANAMIYSNNSSYLNLNSLRVEYDE